MNITVCVCTYRRPDGLRRLLEGLSQQSFQYRPRPQLLLLIVDNEGNPAVKTICMDFERCCSIPTVYIHESQRGISYARNACLEHLPPATNFLAMLDDDEVPQVDWLDQLLRVQADTGADVVYGPVLPVFAMGTPDWIKQAGLFATPRDQSALMDRQELKYAATGNVLLRAELIRQLGLRFDATLTLSGGEDKLFFREIKQAGYRIVWAAYALAWEYVPLHRSRLSYLWRAEFRRGNVKLLADLRLRERQGNAPQRFRLAAHRFFKAWQEIASGIALLVPSLLRGRSRKQQFARVILRIACGLGMLASVFGFQYQHYQSQSIE